MSGIFSKEAWMKVWTYRSSFALGLWNTVQVAVIGVMLSLSLGILFGLMATSVNDDTRLVCEDCIVPANVLS